MKNKKDKKIPFVGLCHGFECTCFAGISYTKSGAEALANGKKGSCKFSMQCSCRCEVLQLKQNGKDWIPKE